MKSFLPIRQYLEQFLKQTILIIEIQLKKRLIVSPINENKNKRNENETKMHQNLTENVLAKHFQTLFKRKQKITGIFLFKLLQEAP